MKHTHHCGLLLLLFIGLMVSCSYPIMTVTYASDEEIINNAYRQDANLMDDMSVTNDTVKINKFKIENGTLELAIQIFTHCHLDYMGSYTIENDTIYLRYSNYIIKDSREDASEMEASECLNYSYFNYCIPLRDRMVSTVLFCTKPENQDG